MPGFRLAIALLRIPRLFVSLLLFPLLLSVILILIQLWITNFAIQTITITPENLKERIEHSQKNNFIRMLIYGDGKRLPPVRVCRWKTWVDTEGKPFELPPKTTPEDTSCLPNRLDIAIHTSHPQTFDSTPYEKIFTGNFERIHLCTSECHPDLILSPEATPPRTDALSLPALLLLNQANFDEPVQKEYVKFFEGKYQVLQLLGTQFFHAAGYTAPIQITNVTYELGLLVSIASIILIALWLAIKAHRKVLDYFSKSGALLPMVAALGKSEFYSAIWIVTLFRVGTFLLASIPSTYILFSGLGTEEAWGGIFQRDIGHFLIWIITLVASFSFAAIVASVADLKHRYNIYAIGYRYLPLALAVLGSFLWIITFLFQDSGGIVRNIVASLPIIGMGPVILVPLFQPSLDVLVIHTLLTLILTLILIRSNAQWFAAHLEDL